MRYVSGSPARLWPALALILFPTAASAHVKWFCAYDVAGQPRGLEQVLCPQFEWLTAIALVCLTLVTLVERTDVGHYSTVGLNWLTAWTRTESEHLVRAVGGGFFVALWTMGGVILTPELKTGEAWISWFQLGLAACFLWRRTLPLAGCGIVVLFGLGVRDYGVFHLADYPVFLASPPTSSSPGSAAPPSACARSTSSVSRRPSP